MSYNVVLMREVLTHIEEHPQGWTQSNWRCETGMCFAGWTAVIAGAEWANDNPNDGLYRYVIAPGGTSMPEPVWKFAYDALGFENYDADDATIGLFEGGNSLPTLRRYVEAYEEIAAREAVESLDVEMPFIIGDAGDLEVWEAEHA